MLKLQQGQLWKTGGEYLRIVDLQRLQVKYKTMTNPDTGEGTHHHVSKKEFCRLIKNATLISAETKDGDDASVQNRLPADPGETK